MDLAHDLRAGMRRLAAGVCVISTRSGDLKYAMTASSVTSLSDNPPSLLVCVNQMAAIHSVLTPGQIFAVNVLQRSAEDVSNICAQPNTGTERFNTGEWVENTGLSTPFLASSLATFFCKVDEKSIVYGTHQIVIGNLVEVRVSDVEQPEPLVYFNGGYR